MSGTVSEDRSGGIETELSAFQQNILVILSEKARYGLAIERELEAYYGGNVNHGRLYPNLNKLGEMGLVEKSERDRRTNEYALTEAGHDAIVDQLAWEVSRFVTTEDRAEEIETLVPDQQ